MTPKNMMRGFLLGTLLGAMAFFAWKPDRAEAENVVNLDFGARAMLGGFYTGTQGVASSANKITNIYRNHIDFNFDAGQAGDQRWGPPVDAGGPTGAQVGDICIVTADLNALGTSDNPECYIKATGVINFEVTTSKTNNDPGDAGFDFLVISNK